MIEDDDYLGWKFLNEDLILLCMLLFIFVVILAPF